MALYQYKGQTRSGRSVQGRKNAAGEKELYTALKEEGIYVIRAKEIRTRRRRKPLRARQLSEFLRQLGSLLGSGVSMVRGLRIIAEDESLSSAERMVYQEVLTSVQKGISLSEAMEEQGKTFPRLLIHMIQSAEEAGNLDDTCIKMSQHYTKEEHLSHKVKNAMVYPRILLGIIVIAVIIIMNYVVPQFQSLFSQMETLPLPTRVLLDVSDFVRTHWILVLVVLFLLWLGIMTVTQIAGVRRLLDRMLLGLPVIGKLQKTICTARFARTLSSLYTAGIPIVTSLAIARDTIGNTYIESQFDEVIRMVRTGEMLHTALAQVDGFTNKLAASVKIGEETGRLDYMLISSADNLDYEAEMAVARMISYVEPAMIIVMAVIVGFIMIAVITPIYGSYETIGMGTY